MDQKNTYTMSLSELSKLYNIDKKVLKKILKKIKKNKKKKAKSKTKSKAKSQTIKFNEKKPQEDNRITYSYGKKEDTSKESNQLQTVIKNSAIDPRDIGILTDKIKDLGLQNKLLITDVVPNLVNTSKTESVNLFNQMNTRFDKLTGDATQKFQYLFDNFGDWNDVRQLTNPEENEIQKQTTNSLSNLPTTYNIRLGENIDEDPLFYKEPNDTLQIPPVENVTSIEENIPDVQEEEKQDITKVEDVEKIKVEDVEEDEEEDVIEPPKPRLKEFEFTPPIGFTVPERGKDEDKRQYGFRVQHYIKKFNNEPISKSSEKKYKTGYLQYLKQLKLK